MKLVDAGKSLKVLVQSLIFLLITNLCIDHLLMDFFAGDGLRYTSLWGKALHDTHCSCIHFKG